MSSVREVIFLGLPGPSHHYGGLSGDNVASSSNRGRASNPRQAALQTLELARLLRRLGITVGILPPLPRPHLALLRTEFSGEPAALLQQAATLNPGLVEKAYSSSAMWAANAATVTPGIDNADGKLHITVANLHSNLHRRIEAEDTQRALQAIFGDAGIVHSPLPASMRDEGAANHTRLSPSHSQPGLHLFVYGADGTDDPPSARQDLTASKEVAAWHGLSPEHCLFIKQNPAVIREGVFHNDVIAVGNASVLLAHENAFAEDDALETIAHACSKLHGQALTVVKVLSSALTVAEAVQSYFFNSQLLSLPGGEMALILPVEAQENPRARALAESICQDAANPVTRLHYADLRQSMRNGGGPACLRLRVPMREEEISAVKLPVWADDTTLEKLNDAIERHYPETLTSADLGKPKVYQQTVSALAAVHTVLQMKPFL